MPDHIIHIAIGIGIEIEIGTGFSDLLFDPDPDNDFDSDCCGLSASGTSPLKKVLTCCQKMDYIVA
jgi:hypothetical protein